MQTSIKSFAVPASSLCKSRAEREAADQSLFEWQRNRAASLCLEWPPKRSTSRAGRPSVSMLWKRALEEAIRKGVCPDQVEAAPPRWWKPGMAVFRSEQDQIADMEQVPGPPAVQPIDEYHYYPIEKLITTS